MQPNRMRIPAGLVSSGHRCTPASRARIVSRSNTHTQAPRYKVATRSPHSCVSLDGGLTGGVSAGSRSRTESSAMSSRIRQLCYRALRGETQVLGGLYPSSFWLLIRMGWKTLGLARGVIVGGGAAR
jgi:hypothetical protein